MWHFFLFRVFLSPFCARVIPFVMTSDFPQRRKGCLLPFSPTYFDEWASTESSSNDAAGEGRRGGRVLNDDDSHYCTYERLFSFPTKILISFGVADPPKNEKPQRLFCQHHRTSSRRLGSAIFSILLRVLFLSLVLSHLAYRPLLASQSFFIIIFLLFLHHRRFPPSFARLFATIWKNRVIGIRF